MASVICPEEFIANFDILSFDGVIMEDKDQMSRDFQVEITDSRTH